MKQWILKLLGADKEYRRGWLDGIRAGNTHQLCLKEDCGLGCKEKIEKLINEQQTLHTKNTR